MDYCDKTKHSKIFCNAYWGRFNYDVQDEQTKKNIDKIIINRDNFITNYKIKKYITKEPLYLSKHVYENSSLGGGKIMSEYDHIEFYETTENDYIIVISPYNTNSDEKLNNLGWVKIDNLYSFDSHTHIKIIPKKHINKKCFLANPIFV